MAIKYPGAFDKLLPANFDGIFDWDFLTPAFQGTKIEPMDIDALVERHGKFLLFETKTLGKDIPQGQQIALEQLLRLGKGNIYLMLLYGKTKESLSAIDEWSFRSGVIKKTGAKTCNADFVLERVSKWFLWANNSKGV